MNAAEIAAALGDARREGRTWRCRCPLHGGRSLVLRDGDAGWVLATCWGGCHRADVLAQLRSRGLLDRAARTIGPHMVAPPRRNDDGHYNARRTLRALGIWRESVAAPTAIAGYLVGRSIVLDVIPPCLRYHARCPRPKDDTGNSVSPMPAMLALVEHVERGAVAVHCTYLRPDRSAKADLPKDKQRACFGPVAGGAVRLGIPRAGEWLAIGEGIETALAVVAACAMPAWAALSAGGIRTLILPPEATNIIICADHDASGTGERAAHDAAARWLAEGRRVRIAMPPEPGTDMADVLAGRPHATTNEQYNAKA
jgi:putative DNA primase/helicase